MFTVEMHFFEKYLNGSVCAGGMAAVRLSLPYDGYQQFYSYQ